MGWFAGTKAYDRTRILHEAAQARAKKKWRKAIALYRRVLAVERHNAEIHAKIAPLLAATGQHFDAWVSFQIVAQACLRKGRRNDALAAYREAASHLPYQIQVWQAIARLELKCGRRPAAVEALWEGASQFKAPWQRPRAIQLLRQAHAVQPWEFDVVFELARLLGRSNQIEEARQLFDGLAERYESQRRRVYAAQFRLDGDLGYAWRWICDAIRGTGAEEADTPAAGGPRGKFPSRSWLPGR